MTFKYILSHAEIIIICALVHGCTTSSHYNCYCPLDSEKINAFKIRAVAAVNDEHLWESVGDEQFDGTGELYSVQHIVSTVQYDRTREIKWGYIPPPPNGNYTAIWFRVPVNGLHGIVNVFFDLKSNEVVRLSAPITFL